MLAETKLLSLSKSKFLFNNIILLRNISISTANNAKDNYKLVVVGGGGAGLNISSRFVRKLGKTNVAIIEPSEWHLYQPGWTLAAGGVKNPDSFRRPQSKLIPSGVDWIKAKASVFEPESNSITLDNGEKVKYDYLVMATGIRIDFDGVKGLKEAMANDEQVVSMYSHETVKNVFPAIQRYKGGNAIFTFPKVPIKCPGAPQKVMYLAEDYFRKNGVRDKGDVYYCTTIPAIFGVKKYAEALMEVVKKREIKLNTLTHLIEIDYKNKQAVFEKLDKPGTTFRLDYSLLHVCPPMKPFDEIKNSPLVDETGYVDLDKYTLQHKKYPNVFGIGDCTNLPTSKTAAAIAAESSILATNLGNLIKGKNPSEAKYDGYTSCPLITGYGKTILAEFDYDGKPLETFPINQGKERRTMFHLKSDFMPILYWTAFVRGYWGGPGIYRKILNIFSFGKN
ncbi:sulfide:quinone mitochondrial [Brachionus plicatilis]|uniref:Sulfide:quinone oxidoreductase, mitochondrial n=1 Tax=Brachionus plicatilis TaxID=10195 RepID=A0A3M7T576_BRAPC|nr:sulfide:quinone mitochondrial [Brachionus plicatilis]